MSYKPTVKNSVLKNNILCCTYNDVPTYVRLLNTNETLSSRNLKLINRVTKVISIFVRREKNNFYYCWTNRVISFLELRDSEISARAKIKKNKRYLSNSNTKYFVPFVTIFFSLIYNTPFNPGVYLKMLILFYYLILILIPFVAIPKLVRKIRSSRSERWTKKAVLSSQLSLSTHTHNNYSWLLYWPTAGWQRMKHPVEKLRLRVLGSFLFFEWRMSESIPGDFDFKQFLLSFQRFRRKYH